ncbi:hypothetical protein BIFDEN_01175 [Bifidobacterium dentium ATCC 27678]|nr:hypothetical protein BIFDEN_01175 [Bifidobacterium dentium ATCC 27678]
MPYERCDDGDFRRLWTTQRLLRRVVDNLVAETTQVIHKKRFTRRNRRSYPPKKWI